MRDISDACVLTRLCRLALLFTIWTAGALSADAQSYRVVRFEPLPGMSAETVAVSDVNNGLFSVGYSGRRPVVWDGEGHVFPLQVPFEIVDGLLINDHGAVVGSGRIGPEPPPLPLPPCCTHIPPPVPYWPAQLFALTNGNYRELPTPANSHGLQLLRLTNSGIVVGGVSGLNPQFFALFGGQVFDLGGIRDPDVSEAGLIGGWHSEAGAVGGLLRWPDGRVTSPWPERTSVQIVGPLGHFVGVFHPVLLGPTATLLYGKPDGSVTRLNYEAGHGSVGVLLRPGSMNRAGHFVGTIYVDSQTRLVFLYRDGQLIDLNTLVSIPEGPITAAWRVTDGGAILASVGFKSILLVPSAPSAPGALTFDVQGSVVTLQWQPSSGAVEYIVEAGSAPGRSDLYRASVGPQLSLTTSAPPGRYHVRVRARNAHGESPASEEVIISVGQP